MSATPAGSPVGDPVFAAFCAAGLWPGLGKRTAADLPAAGITGPDDVSADRLLKLPGSAGSAPSGCSPPSWPPSRPTTW